MIGLPWYGCKIYAIITAIDDCNLGGIGYITGPGNECLLWDNMSANMMDYIGLGGDGGLVKATNDD